MSFDFPAAILQDIQQYAQAEKISAEEALIKLVQTGLKATRRKVKPIAPLTDDEIRQLDGLGKTFGLLADLPDEDVDRMAASIQSMKREGFRTNA